MKKIKILVIFLMVVFVFSGGFLFLAEKALSSQEQDEKEKVVLPEKKLKEAFEALGIRVVEPSLPLEDFTLEDLKGEKVDTKSLRGKFLWLNFWATWCPPCRMEMPSMQKIWEDFGGKNFVLLAINLREDKDKVLSFVTENGYTFPVVLDSNGEVGMTYGVRAIPSNLFVSPEGEIIGAAVGARDWENEKFYGLLREISLSNGKTGEKG